MRRLWLGLLLTCLVVPATAQDADTGKDKEAGDEPVLPDQLDRVSLVVNTGGHSATVAGIFFTPDSKQVVTVSADHTIRLWDAATGEATKVLYPPGFGGIGAAALSADGARLAIGSRYPDGDRTVPVVYVIALADGRIEHVLKGHPQRVEALAFSRDGKQLASTAPGNPKDGPGMEGTVQLWDLATGKATKSFKFWGNPSSVFRVVRRGLAFSPDGDRLACVRLSGGAGEILDLKSAKAKARPLAKIKGNTVAWSPDGKTIATALAPQPNGGIQLWGPDGTPGRRLLPELVGDCYSVAFSGDGKRLLATWGQSGSPQAAIFDVASGERLATQAVLRKGNLWGIRGGKQGALSPDGTLAATTANNVQGIHGFTLWQAADGKPLYGAWPDPAIYQTEAGNRTGWSADGKTISWNKVGKNHAFNLERLELVRGLAQDDPKGKLGRKGETFAIDRNKLLKDGKVVATLVGERPTLVGPDRAASTQHGVIYLYDTATGKQVRTLRGHQDVVNNLIPSPDGKLLLSTSQDQTVKVWSLEQDRPLLSLYSPRGNDWIVWTEEGYYAATPGGERLIGWKVNRGIDQMAAYFAAEQFRKFYYRPDVIRQVLARRSVAAALKAADAALPAKDPKTARTPAPLDKLLPPGVTLALVEPSPLPRVQLKVSARQSCPEQPIKSLRLLVDGRPLPNRQASVTFPDGHEKPQHEETWAVELPPGKHKLSVLARSKDDTPNVSNTLTVACPLPPAARPVLHHVAVGVSKYKNAQLDLSFAAADAEQLADTIARRCGGKGNYYREVQGKCLLDKEATRYAVLEAIRAVRQGAKPNDLFVFSFAGHGVREEGEFFLLTHEADPTGLKALLATTVSGTALRESLAEFPCQVLLMLDACHSGAIGAGPLTGRPAGSDEAARSLADVELRVAVMCAALGHEQALEDKAPDGKGNGLFTRAVLRALKKDPHCFYDHRTGEMSVYHLQAFISQEVANESDNKQTPYLKMPLARDGTTGPWPAPLSARPGRSTLRRCVAGAAGRSFPVRNLPSKAYCWGGPFAHGWERGSFRAAVIGVPAAMRPTGLPLFPVRRS